LDFVVRRARALGLCGNKGESAVFIVCLFVSECPCCSAATAFPSVSTKDYLL
jgi:hypothetical protein